MNDGAVTISEAMNLLNQITSWKQISGEETFECALEDKTIFEISRKSEYQYKLSKFSSSRCLIGVLENDEPLLSETRVSGGRVDKNGYIKADKTPHFLYEQPLYALIQLHGIAKESALRSAT